MPHINDVATAELIDARAAEFVQWLRANTATVRMSTLVSWLRADDDADERAGDTKRPAQSSGPPHTAFANRTVFHSPYSWLASALVGGMGDSSAPRRSPSQLRTLLPSEFERWIVEFHIVEAADAEDQMRGFLSASRTRGH